MSDLTDFLLARIAEDEEVARAVPNPPAAKGSTPIPSWTVTVGRFPTWRADSVFHARHDPARVLAECEAKRRMVEDCQFVLVGRDDDDGPRRRLAAQVLWKMTWPYADHPDYDESWRP